MSPRSASVVGSSTDHTNVGRLKGFRLAAMSTTTIHTQIGYGEVMKEMKTSEILRTAGEVMQKKGYVRFQRHAHNGVCALGAIEDALEAPHHSVGDSCPAVKALAAHIPGSLRLETDWRYQLSYHIANWNNSAERTAEEVIATFFAAAACEAHKENEAKA